MTRVSVRLTLEDCAWGIGAQKAQNSGKRTLVPIELVCRAEPNVFE